MNNLIWSLDSLISYCMDRLADDRALQLAWELRISFVFLYVFLVYPAYALSSFSFGKLTGFTVVLYVTFILFRLVFEAIASIGEPFEEEPFYKLLF